MECGEYPAFGRLGLCGRCILISIVRRDVDDFDADELGRDPEEEFDA